MSWGDRVAVAILAAVLAWVACVAAGTYVLFWLLSQLLAILRALVGIA